MDQIKIDDEVGYIYGKYLVFECQNVYLITHLRMEGKFYIQDPKEHINKHIHVVFS